jgi:Tol biopolymer transport system component
MLRKTLVLRTGALTVVLALAACAGGGSPTKAPPTVAPPTAAATQATPAPVVTVNPTPNATPAAAEGRIAFAVRAGDGSNLFSMLPDGTDMTQLTTDTGNHLCASYTADASQVDYCGDGSGAFEIWTINADGTGTEQLTHLEGRALFPDASHDGKKVAFGGVQGDDTHNEVYVVDASTGDDLVALTSCDGLADGCYNDYPAWSPDDKHIVYIHADDMVNEVAVNAQVWVMNADGSNQKALTSDSPLKDQVPNWSPDGASIVYASGEGVAEGIWVMKSDGSGQHQLSGCLPADESPCPAGEDFGPVWSPDGTKIAFLRSFQELGTEDRPIYVMNADGSDQHRVTEDVILAAVPSWAMSGVGD